ncbi:hypothetical protein [Streptomyces sp. NPDC002054]|uniref:hypothetical protein n=1 Tax=Streptomyces sp. NPDC002054 TaxID=3154663 RepID=UPI00332D1975
MSGISHRKDVQFLEGCNPALVERNADEFKRLRDLLVEVGGPAQRAEKDTRWESDGSGNYVARLAEARKLLADLAEGYDKASSALRAYAAALETARMRYSYGKAYEKQLSDLIATKGVAITPTAQKAEPMRRWEDMRAKTGILDRIAEIGMDVDDIRAEANMLHDAAGGEFHIAKTTEKEARDICVHGLKQAHDLLPDFRLGSGIHRVDIASAMAAMRSEAQEASANPLTHLPGSAPKQGYVDPPGKKDPVSPALADIRTRTAGLPDAKDTYWNWQVPSNDEERRAWIAANKEIIEAAARNSGLPPDMVAGIAWQEIGGQPGYMDDGVQTIRESFDVPFSPIIPENLPGRLGGSPDETSFGPIAIQLRRGAEVLGYDPAHLTDQQRSVIESALQDPKQNIFIASEYLAQLKAESEFAGVPPEQMTPAQYQELAARYNGGPYWSSTDAQGYGRGFMNKLEDARGAMR